MLEDDILAVNLPPEEKFEKLAKEGKSIEAYHVYSQLEPDNPARDKIRFGKSELYDKVCFDIFGPLYDSTTKNLKTSFS